MKLFLITFIASISSIAFPSILKAELTINDKDNYLSCVLAEKNSNYRRNIFLNFNKEENKAYIFEPSNRYAPIKASKADFKKQDLIKFGPYSNWIFDNDNLIVSQGTDFEGKCIKTHKPVLTEVKERTFLMRTSNIKERIRKRCEMYYESEKEANICSNYKFANYPQNWKKNDLDYLGKLTTLAEDNKFFKKANSIISSCENETEDLESCFESAKKICFSGAYDKSNVLDLCSYQFDTCRFGKSMQWERDNYLSLRDCVAGKMYAQELCNRSYKDPNRKDGTWGKFITCIMDKEEYWKAKGSTENKNYYKNSNPYSKHSKCENAADFHGCMNYYSGKTYIPSPSNNQPNTNGFQIWQDSINSQKELRRKFKMDDLEYRIDKMETDALRNRLSP